jgi:hypothetical protein
MDWSRIHFFKKQNECTTNPSRLVVNVTLGLGRAMSNLTLEFYTIITSMEHVDNQGSPYHRCCATMFKGMCLEHVAQLK